MLGFLTPIFLVGVATAAIPIVIHLIHRRRAPVVPFSTLMFLRLSTQRVARRRRLRELLMLAMRCALLLLLALAFAGPILKRRGVSGDGPVHAVFVVDDSFSMGYRHGPKTSFEVARASAASIVEALPKGSEAALLFCGGNRERELPRLTPSVLEVKASVMSAAPSATAVAVGPALARAANVLAESSWPSRELYVFTDLQKRAWQGVDSTGTLDDVVAGGVEAFVIDCGAEAADNVAITELSVGQGGATASDAVPFAVEARNFGRQPRQAEVSLRLGAGAEQLRAVTTMELPGRGAARGTVEQAVENREHFAGSVEVTPDALPIDDTRYFVASQRERIRVVLVGERVGRPSDVFYLRAALQVVGSSVEVFSVAPNQLSGMQLDEYDAVVLGQMEEVPSPTAAALVDFAKKGGGVLMFLGERVSASMYDESLGPLLPARLTEFLETSDQDAKVWEQIDTGHFVFEVFAGPLARDLTFVRTTAHFGLGEPSVADEELPSGSAMRVLARHNDGSPAVVEGACGEGRVILFTASCDGRWSNLPLRASFVPVLHRSILYLAQQKDNAPEEHWVGQPFEFAFPGQTEPVSVEITAPDGGKHVVVSEIEGDRNRAVFRETDLPGLYAIDTNVAASEGAEATRVVAVNVNTEESELARLSEREVKELLPKAELFTAGSTNGIATGGPRFQRGVKLTTGIIAFLVALGLAESILASLFTASRRSDGVRARSLDFAGSARSAGGEEP